jgi:hypothetical protein
MQIRTRPLEQRDLVEADRIMRLAFGTFLGLPEPMKMFGDTDIARTRFRAAPDAALAAEADSKLVGSNFVTDWGSFGFFGPLSVDPRGYGIRAWRSAYLNLPWSSSKNGDAAIPVSSLSVTVPNMSRSTKSLTSGRGFSRL